ncbi:hypothetical protein BJ878DRAFT_539930 [Calycina marina]|uniref:Uncharacterized protein n=1 Tax=Calycina marina TaxID=1763456 RepID=A0A9P8CH01_9HELO|nr:hypothetical protein BJ878DRAFT_539930 [Calycina marina]
MVTRLAYAETIREPMERAMERKTEKRFQNAAVKYKGSYNVLSDITHSFANMTDSDRTSQEDNPLTAGRLAEHVAAYPLEALSITDTARSFGVKDKVPSSDLSFVPVGHISLDPDNEDALKCYNYIISSFYISWAIQGVGLGGAATDISEPLNAKTLLLSTVAKEMNEPSHPR